MFQLGLLLDQDPKKSKKHLMGWFKRFGLILNEHSKLGPKEDEGVINLIQPIDMAVLA